MTNVLPLAAQKKLWGIHRARFIMVFALLLCVLAIAAYLTFIPSFVALQLNAPSDEAGQASTASEALKAMKRAQAQLKIVAPVVSATSSPTAALRRVISLKPAEVTINSMDLRSNRIVLTGSATRESINRFRSLLEADKTFTSVSVPVGALVSDGGHFTMNIGGVF